MDQPDVVDTLGASRVEAGAEVGLITQSQWGVMRYLEAKENGFLPDVRHCTPARRAVELRRISGPE